MEEKIAENNSSRAVISALVRLWLVRVVLGPDHTCSDTDFFTARVLKFRGFSQGSSASIFSILVLADAADPRY
ncbi:hypothetical protein D8B26_001679 [Coccidioides posadasii str. Silveira]|nr:hypothetical protein D8B26_001679 [Coccidioides posadasii str. Silveira]